MSQLICRDLCLGYDGREIVHGLNFEIDAGDYLCIVGENGSGKSTITSILAGMQGATSGEIYYKGELHKVSTMIEGAARGIGMIVQEQGYVFVTVAELLALKGVTPEAGVTYRRAP